MKLKEFIEAFVEPNTLIRLQYKIKGGHEEVLPVANPKMEWELRESKYADREVVGVTDILYRGHYPEAVNLVIKRR